MALSNNLHVERQFSNQATEDSVDNETKPKFPQFAIATKRTDSFKTWPSFIPVQNIGQLVEVGLVYTGVGDSVRCFYCGGGLRNWERGDSPWQEHAKWYPKCPHVLHVKGQEYVNRVQRGEKPDLEKMAVPVSPELLNTEDAINACIQMGYSMGQVEEAIDRYKQTRNGSTSFGAIDLMQSLIDMEDEETDQASTTPKVIAESEQSMEALAIENRHLRESMLCKMCQSDAATITFIPCGHMVCCPQCAPDVLKCPKCRFPVFRYFAEAISRWAHIH